MPKRGFKQGEGCEFVMSYVLAKFLKQTWISKTDSLPSQKRTVAKKNMRSMWCHHFFNERNFQTSWQLVLKCWMFWFCDSLRQIFAPCICLYGLLAMSRIGATRRIASLHRCIKDLLMQQRYHGEEIRGTTWCCNRARVTRPLRWHRREDIVDGFVAWKASLGSMRPGEKRVMPRSCWCWEGTWIHGMPVCPKIWGKRNRCCAANCMVFVLLLLVKLVLVVVGAPCPPGSHRVLRSCHQWALTVAPFFDEEMMRRDVQISIWGCQRMQKAGKLETVETNI